MRQTHDPYPDIARPEVFLGKFHAPAGKGRIVLERRTMRGVCRSQIFPEDAGKLARVTCKVPDVLFSPCSFRGLPLLLNFENINCLYVQLPVTDVNKRRLYDLMEEKGFPIPTVVTTDGARLSFFWFLARPISRQEYFKVFLMQHGLFELVKNLTPYCDTLSISSLVGLPGTINSTTDGYVGVITPWGSRVDNGFAETFLTGRYRIPDYKRLRLHSRAIPELLALMHDRVLLRDSAEDWLIFFAASLCHFCSTRQLLDELRAIAVSLEGRSWNQLASTYGRLIEDLSTSKLQGFVGNGFSIDRPDWFSLVAGKLRVSEEEIKRLGLSVIVGETDEFFSTEVGHVMPVGEVEFVPVERLFMRAVA